MDHTNNSSSSCSAPLKDVEGQSLSPAARAKVDRICKACQDGPDTEALLQLAISEHGLVYDEARRKACTLHLQCPGPGIYWPLQGPSCSGTV